jgi:hypothetical protein
MLERLGSDEKWFAAAHNWDVAAAKLAGYVNDYGKRSLLTWCSGSKRLTVLSGRKSAATSCLERWTLQRLASLKWLAASSLHRRKENEDIEIQYLVFRKSS